MFYTVYVFTILIRVIVIKKVKKVIKKEVNKEKDRIVLIV
jgi:hypothetical protein